MLYLLPLAGLLRICAAGGVYTLPHSAIVSTSEAHGPLARLALSSARGPQALQYYRAAASVVTPHAPVVVSQPTAFALPTYLSQPSYVQKLVDIPTAKARLQVRRPAIQKQFYDIEQRTIIRPVGSAVVELEEPLSKTYISPFTVTPTAHQASAKYHNQAVYPVASYPFGPYAPFQAPAQTYPLSFIQQPQYVSQRPVLAPQLPQQFPSYPPQTQPQLPAIPPVEARPPQQFPIYPKPPQQAQPQPPAQPPQQFPIYPQPPQQSQPQPPAAPPAQPPQQFPILPPRPDDSTGNDEFDSSDTVVIDNPDFTRSANRPREFSRREQESRSLSATEANTIQETQQKKHHVPINKQQLYEDSQARNQQILDEFQSRQLLRMFLSQPMSHPPQRFQQILPLQSNEQFQTINLDEAKTLLRSQGLPSLEPIDYESKSTSTESTSTTETVKEQTTEEITEDYKTETTSKTDQSPPNVSLPSLESQESSQRIHRQYFNEEIDLVSNLSPQEAQDNQQKFIELLTGQGDVSEIDLSRSGVRSSVVGDSGLVRGRVLSVTPAPITGQVGDERVSTRRVVVSRPIQTLEEVDVHEPFTKVERVEFHGPTPTALVYH